MKEMHYSKKIALTVFIALLWSFLLIFISYPFLNGGTSYSTIPTYTITNGAKTIVFQGMIHIGLKSFYHEVGREMNYYGDSGYKVMLEGLGTSGVKPLNKIDPRYEQSVETYQKRYEPYINKFTAIEAKEYVNTKYIYQYLIFDRYRKYDYETVDLTKKKIEEAIITSEKKLNIDYNDETISEYKLTLGDHSEAFDILLKNEKKYIYLRNMNDFFLFSYTDKYIQPLISTFSPSFKLNQEITLKARDQNLANAILAEENKKIYVAYGSAHFEGLFNLLKEKDPNWQIVKTTHKIAFKRD